MKAHIGKAGPGSQPICGRGTTCTSGYSTDRASWSQLSPDFQCNRCKNKIYKYEQAKAARQAVGSN